MEKESPGRVALRLQLEGKVAALAREIGPRCPPGHGFTIFMFEYGDGGALAYASNAQRADMIQAVEEWLRRVRDGVDDRERYRAASRLQDAALAYTRAISKVPPENPNPHEGLLLAAVNYALAVLGDVGA